LREAVDDALDDALPVLKERGVRLSLAADPPVGDFMVRGDRDKLACLVRNLVDNAARYSPAGSSVRVELACRADRTCVAVCDEGPGIAPALRERVFESYYRIPGAAGDGSGLGLAIVREIASQHDATVEIGAGDGGRGTRVSVLFRP
jgi:signal transduction histidine kinase